MAKVKATVTAVAAPVTAPAVALYSTKGAKPYNPKPNTKNGNGGCAGTWAAVLAHLSANGPSTLAALTAVAVANGDPKFITYMVGGNRLVPYVADAAATPAA